MTCLRWIAATAATLTISGMLCGQPAQSPARMTLGDALKSGRNDVVAAFLARGLDVNVRDGGGNTPLHYAAEAGQKETVAFLLGKGAQFEAKNTDGATPLYVAVLHHRKVVAELLAAKGADVNVQDQTLNLTPLHLACSRKEDKDIALMLMEHKADMNAKDRGGETPLFYAAATGDVDLVAKLMEKGGDVTIETSSGRTALHSAAERKKSEVAEYLMKKGLEEDIFVAAELCRTEKVREFLRTKPELANASDGSFVVLARAAQNEHRDVVAALLEAGADANGCTASNGPALIHAAAAGCKDVVELLLAKGAKVDASMP